MNCIDLITPDKIGHQEFERYEIADKLHAARDEFLHLESKHYIICCHGRPRYEADHFRLFADIYYMFDKENGELVITYLRRQEGLKAAESQYTPNHQETEATPIEKACTESVCLDDETPIIEVEFEQYGIARMLQNGQFRSVPPERSPGQQICYSDRTIDEAVVLGDELYFRFDVETGGLLMERIHDFPEKRV